MMDSEFGMATGIIECTVWGLKSDNNQQIMVWLAHQGIMMRMMKNLCHTAKVMMMDSEFVMVTGIIGCTCLQSGTERGGFGWLTKLPIM